MATLGELQKSVAHVFEYGAIYKSGLYVGVERKL